MKRFQQKTLELISKAKLALEQHRPWWPLTLRQIYYRLVAWGVIDNSDPSYKRLSTVLVDARMEGLIEWEAMEDRSRRILEPNGWEGVESYVEAERAHFLRRYRRDLMQEQLVAVEVWVEKDALSHLVYQVASRYCARVVVARGFASASYLNQARERILANAENGQDTTILYFGDLDPSGWEMPLDIQNRLEEMGVGESVKVKRCALNLDHVNQFKLSHNPDQLKPGDPNAQKFVAQFGLMAVELDALSPEDLQRLVQESIEQEIDMGVYRAALEEERADREKLGELRARVEQALETI